MNKSTLNRYAILNDISKKTNFNNINNFSNKTNESTSNNQILLTSNNNANYKEELISLISNYITNYKSVQDLVETIDEMNENYVKEMVIHWNTYESILKSIKGTINMEKLISMFADKLNEEIKKKDIPNKTFDKTINDIDFFFNDNNRIHKDLPDSDKIIKHVLTYILNLPTSSSDRVILIALTNLTNVDKINDIKKYKHNLDFKIDMINEVIRLIDKFPFNAKFFQNYISLTNKDLQKNNLNEFEEKIKIMKDSLSKEDINDYLLNSNSTFVNAFYNTVSNNQNFIRDNIQWLKDEKLKNKKKEVNNDIVNKVKDINKRKQDEERIRKEEEEKYQTALKEQEEKIKSDSKANRKENFDQNINDFTKSLRDKSRTGKQLLKIYNTYFPGIISQQQIDLINTRNPQKTHQSERKDLITYLKQEILDKLLSQTDPKSNVFDKLYDKDDITQHNGLENIYSTFDVSNGLQKTINDAFKHYGHGILVQGYGLKNAIVKNNRHTIKDKFYVDKRLLNNGILDVRYIKNGHKVSNVNHHSLLSNDAVNTLKDMINGVSINNDNFVRLNNFEKDLLRRFNNHYLDEKYKLNDNDDDLFHKNYEILLGEWKSGNNNHLIKKQLESYIDHAVDIGKLSHHQARRIKNSLFFNV